MQRSRQFSLNSYQNISDYFCLIMQISLKYLFGEPECKNGPAAKMFCGLDISKPELDQNGTIPEQNWTRTELDQNGTIPEQNWTRTELHQNGTKAERYQNSIVSERIYIRKGKQKKEKEKERKGKEETAWERTSLLRVILRAPKLHTRFWTNLRRKNASPS